MARLTLQLGGPLVVPIITPRQLPFDWRIQSLAEAGLAATAGRRRRRDDVWRLVEPPTPCAIAPEHGQVQGASQ